MKQRISSYGDPIIFNNVSVVEEEEELEESLAVVELSAMTLMYSTNASITLAGGTPVL